MVSKFSLLCTLWLGLLGLLAAFGPHDAVAAERADRLTREAIALFRSVVKQHKPREFGSCTLTDRWNDYPVPEEVARRHLGMKLHAELVLPSRTTPAEVIDPEGAIRQAFCSNSEAAKQTEALVEEFRSGTINIEKGPHDLNPRLTVAIRDYSFPIFDLSYRRAVIVTTYESRQWVKVSNGEVQSLGIFGAGVAMLYAKHGRLWQRVALESLFDFD